MTTNPPKPPTGLGKRGRTFWRDVVAEFDLTDAERHLLHEACRSLDRIDALEALVADEGMTVTGSTGQTVLHPGIAEARQQRLVLGRLVKQLELPDEDTPPTSSMNTDRARYAAQQRWSRAGRRQAGA